MFLNQQHLELLKQGGAATWNTWRRSHPATVPELHGADLRGVDLSNYNLSTANLMSANLGGANLNWARLTDAIITEEQLSSVKSRLEGTL